MVQGSSVTLCLCLRGVQFSFAACRRYAGQVTADPAGPSSSAAAAAAAGGGGAGSSRQAAAAAGSGGGGSSKAGKRTRGGADAAAAGGSHSRAAAAAAGEAAGGSGGQEEDTDPVTGQLVSVQGFWTCEHCTLRNEDVTSVACEVCGIPRWDEADDDEAQ